MSDAVSDRITVQAGADAVMEVIADFEAYPEWQSDIKAVEVLETDEDGWGTRVRFSVDAKIFTTTYVLGYTYLDPDTDGAYGMRWRLVQGDQLKKVDGTYLLDDQGDGTTLVTYDLEIVPAISLPKMLRRKAAQRIVDSALSGMKQRVESASQR